MSDMQPPNPPPQSPDDLRIMAVPVKPPPPRIWPTLIVAGAIVPAMLVVMVLLVSLLMIGGLLAGEIAGVEEAEQWLFEQMQTPALLLALLVPFQLLMLAAAFIPAYLSPQRFADRLGFVRSHCSWLVWPLLMLGTIFVMLMSATILDGLFDEPSPALEDFSRAITDASLPVFIVMLLFVSLAPGIAEEALFRGYIQRRLLQRWSPWLAIGLTSVVFAAIHMDVQHVIGVLPIGVWLGIIAWRTGSLWPCVLCHVFNNAVAVTLARVDGDDFSMALLDQTYPALLMVCGLAFIASIPVLVLCGWGKSPRVARPRERH